MTPLKQPITLTLTTVEQAIAVRIGLKDLLLGDRSLADKRKRFSATDGRLGGQIERHLAAEGINFYTWEPAAPIRIGIHAVEFKSDAIQVGCKTVPHETVRAIAARLEQPPVETNRKAIINVHGDETLSRIVQELAFKAGYQWPNNRREFEATYGAAILVGGWWDGDSAKWLQRAQFEWATEKQPTRQTLDARKDFGAVLDFFRQPSVPEIQIGGEAVKFNGNESVTFAGETVSREAVREIVKRIGG